MLDEPGNHLDVETVEALAHALCAYAGTVIFTSHDRTFVTAVATNVIEVAAGRVVHYPATYKRYVEKIEKEVDDAEGLRTSRHADGDLRGKRQRNGGHDGRKRRKTIASLEKAVAKLDAEKQKKQTLMEAVTDPEEAMKIHSELQAVEKELAAAEDKWLSLQEEADV